MSAVVAACTGALHTQAGGNAFFPPGKWVEVILKLSTVLPKHRDYPTINKRTKIYLQWFIETHENNKGRRGKWSASPLVFSILNTLIEIVLSHAYNAWHFLEP